jgi:hypothetical protein
MDARSGRDIIAPNLHIAGAGAAVHKSIIGREGRFYIALIAICAASSAVAQTLPPTLAVCAAHSDAMQRLACYDREVARLRGTGAAAATPAAPAKSPASTVPDPLNAPVAPAFTASSVAMPGEAAPAVASPVVKAKPLKHLSAHVIGVERHADGFAVHLDNGQTWVNSDASPVSSNLRAGDEVSIDRSLGSYWLSGNVGEGVKVRQKTDPVGDSP